MDNERGDGMEGWRELADEMRGVLARGQAALSRQAHLGRVRLELVQLKRDERAVYERLGREVRRLLQDEVLPMQVELQRPSEVLDELEARIQSLEEDLGTL